MNRLHVDVNRGGPRLAFSPACKISESNRANQHLVRSPSSTPFCALGLMGGERNMIKLPLREPLAAMLFFFSTSLGGLNFLLLRTDKGTISELKFC